MYFLGVWWHSCWSSLIIRMIRRMIRNHYILWQVSKDIQLAESSQHKISQCHALRNWMFFILAPWPQKVRWNNNNWVGIIWYSLKVAEVLFFLLGEFDAANVGWFDVLFFFVGMQNVSHQKFIFIPWIYTPPSGKFEGFFSGSLGFFRS